MATKSQASNTAVTTLDDEDAPVPAAAVKEALKISLSENDAEFCGDTAEITIQPSAGENGSHAVFLNVNSTSVLIPRNVRVVLPIELKEALDNCTIAVPEIDPTGTSMTMRDAPRYSYVVHAIKKKA